MDRGLVPLHRGFDWLISSHFRMGRCFRSNEEFDAAGDAAAGVG